MSREQEKDQLEQGITQAEEKERRYNIQTKILLREQSQLDRKKRNHRFFTRGAMLESFLKKPLIMTDDHVYELLKTAFSQSDVQTKETTLLKEEIDSLNGKAFENKAFSEQDYPWHRARLSLAQGAIIHRLPGAIALCGAERLHRCFEPDVLRNIRQQGQAPALVNQLPHRKKVTAYCLSAFQYYHPAAEQRTVLCCRCRLPERRKVVQRI